MRAACNTCHEQGCCCTIERAVPTASDFMQASQCKATTGQMPVERLDAKGQKLLLADTGPGDLVYTLAKLLDTYGWRAM